MAGDGNGQRQILHEAADEGRIAGYNVCREEPVMFARKVPLMIVFTDPNICMTGVSPGELEDGEYVVGEIKVDRWDVPWTFDLSIIWFPPSLCKV